MFTGFRDFVTKGNVIDVAVGFVAGAAFTALISGITGAIITPLIGLISGGGVNAGVFTINGQVFDITTVVNAIITFILTMALLYFVFVAPMNRWRARNQKDEEVLSSITDIELLTEIRDLLKRNVP
jgi:large conductance mechanosensitive channel